MEMQLDLWHWWDHFKAALSAWPEGSQIERNLIVVTRLLPYPWQPVTQQTSNLGIWKFTLNCLFWINPWALGVIHELCKNFCGSHSADPPNTPGYCTLPPRFTCTSMRKLWETILFARFDMHVLITCNRTDSAKLLYYLSQCPNCTNVSRLTNT